MLNIVRPIVCVSAAMCVGAATTQPVRPTLAEPSASTLTFGRLFTAVHLQAMPPLSAVTCTALPNAAEVSPKNPVDLGAVLSAATPIRPDDPSIDTWQYAPAYAATFAADGRRWSARLFLGGRGTIEDDAGRKALFSFAWPPSARP